MEMKTKHEPYTVMLDITDKTISFIVGDEHEMVHLTSDRRGPSPTRRDAMRQYTWRVTHKLCQMPPLDNRKCI